MAFILPPGLGTFLGELQKDEEERRMEQAELELASRATSLARDAVPSSREGCLHRDVGHYGHRDLGHYASQDR